MEVGEVVGDIFWDDPWETCVESGLESVQKVLSTSLCLWSVNPPVETKVDVVRTKGTVRTIRRGVKGRNEGRSTTQQ